MLSRLSQLVGNAIDLFRHGGVEVVADRLGEVWNSRQVAFGLKRDMSGDHLAPEANFPLHIRPLRADDVATLLQLPADAGADDEIAVGVRRRMIEADLPGCWVAAAVGDDRPCYVQWLFDHHSNAALLKFFGGDFPPLAPDTALLEGAYTPPHERGQRVMAAGMSRIAEKADGLGTRYVITFVGDDNIASLKGCERAGFVPYLTRTVAFRRLRRTSLFDPLTPSDGYPLPLPPERAGTPTPRG